MNSDYAAEALRHKEVLERGLEQGVEGLASAGDVLAALDRIPMSIGILAETQVGATVSKLRKVEGAPLIVKQAKTLVKKWKGVAQAGGVEKAASAPAAAAAAAASAVGKKKPAQSKAGAVKKATPPVKKAPATAAQSPGGGVGGLRQKMQDKFADLLTQTDASPDPSSGGQTPQGLARAIEEEVNRTTPLQGAKDAYVNKMRELSFNLKKNAELRTGLLSGGLSAARLCTMTTEELMCSTDRDALKAQHDEAFNAARLDWTTKNFDKIQAECGIKGEGMFRCIRCKSKKTTFAEKQMRSGDEPMSCFIQCHTCGKRWRVG